MVYIIIFFLEKQLRVYDTGYIFYLETNNPEIDEPFEMPFELHLKKRKQLAGVEFVANFRQKSTFLSDPDGLKRPGKGWLRVASQRRGVRPGCRVSRWGRMAQMEGFFWV